MNQTIVNSAENKTAPSPAIVLADMVHPFVDNLRWILENTKDPNGRKWSMRSLSLAAGLAHGHVGHILGGRLKPENVGLGPIEALAKAADVSPSWLATGIGEPNPTEDPEGALTSPAAVRGWDAYEERYPSRAIIVALAGDDVSKHVIDALRSICLSSDDDPGEDFWQEQLVRLTRRGRGLTRQLRELNPPELTDKEKEILGP